MTTAAHPVSLRPRDAERSRARILDAAEDLFAEHGPRAISLGAIARRAGVARATPSYFFANKDGLHRAVLERVFAERERATLEALEPVRVWSPESSAPLDTVVEQAVDAYLGFLISRPAFVRLVTWEGLDGGAQLARTPRASRAMHDSFTTLAKQTATGFDADDAVLVLVSLTFMPLVQRDTLMATLARNLDDPDARQRHVQMVAAQLMVLIGRS